MSRIVYQIVEHDGGWAYRADGVYSETFPTRETAHRAAERVAAEQRAPGDTVGITYEDAAGRWRKEISSGDDRPETEVDG